MEMLAIIIISLVVFAIQLLLCFKVKNVALKLIPVLIFLIATVGCIIRMKYADGWDALDYFIYAFICGVFFLSSVVGWVVWIVSCCIKKKKSNSLRD